VTSRTVAVSTTPAKTCVKKTTADQRKAGRESESESQNQSEKEKKCNQSKQTRAHEHNATKALLTDLPCVAKPTNKS
jgi:hypothetical protein